MHSRRPPKSLHTWGHSFALGGVFLTALLLSASVRGYVGKIEHTVHSQDQKSLRLVYTFEWEVANSEKFLRTNLDKAQIQDRVLLELRARIKKQIERISHDEALKLIAGERFEQLRATAVETNGTIESLGVQIIDIDFQR